MDMAAQHPTAALLSCEVVMEILSWVPAKPLTRLKLVCKSWNSIISHPHFVKLHLRRSPKNAILLSTRTPALTLGEEGKQSIVLSSVESFIQNPSSALDAQENRHSLHVQDWVSGSCNGLVCVARILYHPDNDICDIWFRLLNPLTGFISENSPCLHVNVHNAFGFGYDESSDSYKVVTLIPDSSGTVTAQVYSFGGSSWKTINSFPAFPILAEDYSDHFIGGTLNWLGLRNPHGGDYDWAAVTLDMLMIVSFDLKSDTNKQILLPKGIDEIPAQEPILGVWGNRLYLLHDYKNTHFIAWQMKEFGDENSWTQLLKISFHHLGVETLLPEFIFENGNIFMLIGRGSFEEVFYDRRDNSVKRLNFFSNNRYLIAFDYVESLVLPC
ncbi:F-box/kelch-repeat protein At3g23880-like [Arachis stenosperma]|uniref:F-box/kelch-repeat protein At3g23880-like n=1 Tax=Arachis stenosperma TaxID=217475 RepID=UPI0025AB5DE0|nr:F-box/kelch-repeat protein At3g23880-like [Arachis stenosperma]XP_057737217.1 F-box/kelch-repeat protein At3g23880-like [Arachis stenosperma]XP_057737218.1 F-box/kelch-repeat protein At3g23880-like [Arachis stenosperma]